MLPIFLTNTEQKRIIISVYWINEEVLKGEVRRGVKLMSNLVEFQESERSPVGSQAASGRGIPNLATSVACILSA